MGATWTLRETVVVAVLGLDDRPQARAHFRIAPAAAARVSYTPTRLGEVYDFPPGTDGGGQTIAIVELGGGYAQADLDAYFSGLGLAGVEELRKFVAEGGTLITLGDASR